MIANAVNELFASQQINIFSRAGQRSIAFPMVRLFGAIGRTGNELVPDGSLVIVGNMAKIYPSTRTLFRSVRLDDKATMQVPELGGGVKMFDFYGNPLPSNHGTFTVPLNGLGYFLRCDGKPGSFARLVDAVRKAKTVGIEPVEITAHDMTSPVNEHPKLRLELTNVLNRPVEGILTAQLGGLHLSQAPAITLAANETREIALEVTGSPAMSNAYPLKVRFEAGADGSAEHAEEMHANVISRRTVKVDGDLSDWKGVLPQVLPGSGIGASQTEQAYLPFMTPGESGGSGASTLFRFNQFPGRSAYYGVELHCLKLIPNRPHVLRAGRTGVMQFARQQNHWAAVHNELRYRAGLHQPGQGRLRQFLGLTGICDEVIGAGNPSSQGERMAHVWPQFLQLGQVCVETERNQGTRSPSEHRHHVESVRWDVAQCEAQCANAAGGGCRFIPVHRNGDFTRKSA